MLGREFVVETWFANHRALATGAGDETPWEFWAWNVVESSTAWGTPKEQWDLVLTLLGASDTNDSLYAVAAGPLEDFIHNDWRFALEVIEPAAPRNVALRSALSGANLPLELPDEAQQRFRALVLPS